MNKAIWKFPIEAPGREQTTDIKMPAKTKILGVQNNPALPSEGAIYAVVNSGAKPEAYVSRRFHVCGTGWALPEAKHIYVGSWQHEGFIWHVLEIL